MPGSPSSYLNTGSGALDKLLYSPIPGVNTAGFDQLSEGYAGAEEQGISDIASRGLTTTGAAPTMYQGLRSQYNQGAAQVNAQGSAQTQQQRLQILNSLLGLGGDAANAVRANIGSTAEDVSGAGDVLSGLFGTPTAPNYVTGAPGSGRGLLSAGLFSGQGSLLSQIQRLI